MMFASGYAGPSFSHIWKLGPALSAPFFVRDAFASAPFKGTR